MSAPFVAGQRVRVRETRAIEFNDGGKPRRWFRVDFDYPKRHAVVLMGGLLPEGQVMCSTHGINAACACITAVTAFIRETR